MANTTDTAGKPGKNSGVLSDDDIAALQHWHERKIREAQCEADKKKAELKEATDEVRSRFAALKSDLLMTRKDMEELIAAKDLSEAEFRMKEAARAKRFELGGLPIGTQLKLDLAGDTVTDKQMAEADGRRAYHAFKDRMPPDTVASYLHPDWLRGWDEEQTASAMKLSRAEAIIASRAEPDADAEAVDLNDEENAEEEIDLSPEAIDAKARKLKRQQFMERGTSVEPGDEQPAAA